MMFGVQEEVIEANLSSEISQPEDDFQAQLAEQIMGLFDLVTDERRQHYANNPQEIPNEQSIPSIINSYSGINAAISGAASLVPGPFGMLAAIPEIISVLRNQVAMIYDIAVAYGQSPSVLTKELLAGVLISAVGAGAGTLIVMQGGKVLIQRVTLRAFQQIVMLLAGKVTQQMLKSMISKWLPVVGAAAMAAWSNYMTRQIGDKAVEIMKQKIEINDADASIDEASGVDMPANQVLVNTTKVRIQTLINLMKVDGEIAAEEQSYLQILIEQADFAEEDRAELTQGLTANQKFAINYEILSTQPDDAIALLMDLVALANRDGTFHIAEKMYIKQVGRSVGFSDNDIEEMMKMTV